MKVNVKNKEAVDQLTSHGTDRSPSAGGRLMRLMGNGRQVIFFFFFCRRHLVGGGSFISHMCSGWFCKQLMNSVTGWFSKQIW